MGKLNAISIVQSMLGLALLCQPAASAVVELPQGWTSSDRELWWNSPQGSRIIPYEWFVKLALTDSAGLFAAPEHLAAYGFIAAPASPINPAALPIGFSHEQDQMGEAWVGMTCAACHVRTIAYQGKAVLVEGGGAMIDFQRFDRDLSAALSATAANGAKFAAFATRLGTAEADRANLHEQFDKIAADRAAVTAMNMAPHDSGPGRVDALGAIMNALTVTALDKRGNARPPDAPVRLPWIWNSATYSRVQYNGSISNAGLGPLLRNLGQTLGVYGSVDLAKLSSAGYTSSVNVEDLDRLEALLKKLGAPPWPADVLPPINQAYAKRGEAVFDQACASCHAPTVHDEMGLLTVALVPLDKIGTDPTAAKNFMTRAADTGILEGRPIGVLGGPTFGPRAGAATIVGHVSTGVALQVNRDRLQAGLAAYRAAITANPGRLDAYKATPLSGVWTGAPYLHNGSVANLQQLLTPVAERATRFTVGNREFDTTLVGYPADTSVTGFTLDTTLPGNSNSGHDYGTTLSVNEKANLIEYLKGL